MGEKIVPLEMNLVRYSNPVSVTEREEKLPSMVSLNKYTIKFIFHYGVIYFLICMYY